MSELEAMCLPSSRSTLKLTLKGPHQIRALEAAHDAAAPAAPATAPATVPAGGVGDGSEGAATASQAGRKGGDSQQGGLEGLEFADEIFGKMRLLQVWSAARTPRLASPRSHLAPCGR